MGFFSCGDGGAGGGGTRTWRGTTARSASTGAAGWGTAPALAERRRDAFATSLGGFSSPRSPPLPALLRTPPLLPPLLPLLASSDADRDRRGSAPPSPRDAPRTLRSTEADRDGGVGRRSLAPLLLLLPLTLFLSSSSSSLFLLGFVTALPGMRLDAAASPTGARLPHL